MKWAHAVVASLALVACSTSSTPPAIVHLSAAEHGRALFSDPTASSSPLNNVACASCHRVADDASDVRLLPGGALAGASGRASYWAGQEIELLRAVNDCRTYFMQARDAWTADDEEAKALWAYLSSLPGDAKPIPFTIVRSVVDLPAGDPNVGGDVYARACKSCHGAVHTGEGALASQAPRIPDQVSAQHLQYSRTDQRVIFIEKIRHGGFLGYGGFMPPFSIETLTDVQIGALLAYLGLY